MSPRMARSLNALFEGEHQIFHIREKFGTGDLADEDWIRRLGTEGGWSVLSGDIRIAKKRPSRELFLRSNLIGFFPLPTLLKLSNAELTARLLMRWNDLVLVGQTTERGVYEVPIRGKLRQITG